MSTPFLALGSRWYCQAVVLAHKETMERQERWPGSKVSPLHAEMPRSPGGTACAAQGPLCCCTAHTGQPLKAAGQTSHPNPALILLLPCLLLRKRAQDSEPHPEVLWAASAARWCSLRSRRLRSPCSRCSSTGFCRSNTRAASLLAQSLVSSQSTCWCQTKPVVCSMEFNPELFKIWQSRNVSKLRGSLQENSTLINFRCYFLPPFH